MAITIYPNTPVNVAIVESTAERHHVWIDRDTIYLYTGSDCPQIIVCTGDDYLPYAPAPTEIDAQTYVNQMPDEQLDWALDQAFGSSPDPDTRRTLFRKSFSSPGVTVDFGDSSVSALQNKITQVEKGGGIVRIAPVAVRS